jgi:hypothetical protein
MNVDDDSGEIGVSEIVGSSREVNVLTFGFSHTMT